MSTCAFVRSSICAAHECESAHARACVYLRVCAFVRAYEFMCLFVSKPCCATHRLNLLELCMRSSLKSEYLSGGADQLPNEDAIQ